MPQINITNVEKIEAGQYRVDFNSDFEMVDFFYQISTNGSIWNTPAAIGTISPQIISVPNLINFYVRFGTGVEDPTPPEYLKIHTNVFTNTFN